MIKYCLHIVFVTLVSCMQNRLNKVKQNGQSPSYPTMMGASILLNIYHPPDPSINEVRIQAFDNII